MEPQLRVPGPTPLPQRVIRSASRPMINHRGPEFAEILQDCIAGLQWALQTSNDILIFPASGSGGLEAAVANLLSPGEKALFCSMGAFGDRWAEMAEKFGVNVVRLSVPWGEPIDSEDVDAILAEHADIRKVFVTHNETSTGITNDISAIAGVVKSRGHLLAVDSVSGAGSLPLPMDSLGIDVVVCGSQKGWMAPPGLTMIAVSAAAMAANAEARCPRWYFDFARQLAMQQKGQTLTTPPVSVMYALQEGLTILREEGLQQVFGRHYRMATMIRAGLAAMGLRFVAPESHRSNTVTAIHSPFDNADDLKQWLSVLRIMYGVVLAGGQGQLQGKTFRIGHLGLINEPDVYAILAAIEQSLCDRGMVSRIGVALPAAQEAARIAVRVPAPVG